MSHEIGRSIDEPDMLSGEIGIDGFWGRIKFAAKILFTGCATFEVTKDDLYGDAVPGSRAWPDGSPRLPTKNLCGKYRYRSGQ